MEDERFKNCVEFEFSRVTNLFEKIIHLNKLKIELGKNPDHPLIIKSIKLLLFLISEYSEIFCIFFVLFLFEIYNSKCK